MTLLVLLACATGTAERQKSHDTAIEHEDSGTGDDTADTRPPRDDADGDGYTTPFDCDDADPAVHPGTLEVCDLVDNNCDGAINEGMPVAPHWLDGDGDGWGVIAPPTLVCALAGGVRVSGDCDDTDPTIGRGKNWYADGDGDGYGDQSTAVLACAAPAPGYVADGTDCDDADPTAWAGVEWYPDADGDGFGDEGAGEYECSAPGDGRTAFAGDCDDAEPAVNPGALDDCTVTDGLDNDCSGAVQDGNCYSGFGVSSEDSGGGGGCYEAGPITGTASTSATAGDIDLAWEPDLPGSRCAFSTWTFTLGYDFDNPRLVYYNTGTDWYVFGPAEYDWAHSVLEVQAWVYMGWIAPNRSGGDIWYEFEGRFFVPPP